MSESRSPPEEPPSFEDLTPDAVLAETDGILNHTLALHDRLVATVTPTSATFANVIRPIVDDGNRAACRLHILGELLSQLSPSLEVRRAGREVEKRVAAARTRNLMRCDVAALVFAAYEKETATPSGGLDREDRYVLSVVRGQYVRSGAGLGSDEDRETFRAASEQLSEICAAAQDTMVNPEEGIWFERTELEGVPEALLSTMVEDGTRIQVTFRKDHVSAVMRYAASSDTRRRFMIANWHRLPENVGRLNKAVALRDEIARLLGYEHHAALKIKSRMAPTVEYVKAQLEELHARLGPISQAKTDRLREFKKKHSAAADDNGQVSELYEWDKAYYSRKQQEDHSKTNHSLLAEYFEARHTFEAMLRLFHDLFGMEFKPIATSVWHESIISYQVWDTPSEGGKFLGYLYVDLYEREGKYRGAHCIGIQPGFTEQSGMKHYPATVLACCYAAPSHSGQTLLRHAQVTTMFHELGHAIHELVSRTKYAVSRSRDYSEIPSIMLENWTWNPDVLIRIGKHYTTLDNASDTGILPRDLAESICATKNSGRANAILSHVWPALFDLAIHTPPTHTAALTMDTTAIWNTTKQRVVTASCGHDPTIWGAGQARFIHMFRHNDAGYFSYPLSMAYAADLFAEAFKKDPMDVTAARRWRYQVLEKGASRPGMEILTEFLGRKVGVQAVLEELGA